MNLSFSIDSAFLLAILVGLGRAIWLISDLKTTLKAAVKRQDVDGREIAALKEAVAGHEGRLDNYGGRIAKLETG